LTGLGQPLADIHDPVVADILRAATAEFAQYGLGGARLERIIANTRTSKRMIYYHFTSKEGLYQGVLEQVFSDVRSPEQDFDPYQGSPVDALRRFAEIAFDAFSMRPDFVRLLTFENLSGATHIRGSALISKLNQRGLQHVEAVLERGRRDGNFRHEVAALDVFMNLIGLSYYHVANHAGYVAGGFSSAVDHVLKDSEFHHHRRRMVADATVRFVSITPP
jgi:AcrR family transcriptional regulator